MTAVCCTGGGSELLIIQATGVAAVAAYIGIVMTLILQALDKTIGLRVSTREEIAGLDMEEHGLASSYADFMPAAEDFPWCCDCSGSSRGWCCRYSRYCRSAGSRQTENDEDRDHYFAAAF